MATRRCQGRHVDSQQTSGLFPPLVNGTVVMLIGLTLVPVGMDYAAGGSGGEDYGSMTMKTDSHIRKGDPT